MSNKKLNTVNISNSDGSNNSINLCKIERRLSLLSIAKNRKRRNNIIYVCSHCIQKLLRRHLDTKTITRSLPWRKPLYQMCGAASLNGIIFVKFTKNKEDDFYD